MSSHKYENEILEVLDPNTEAVRASELRARLMADESARTELLAMEATMRLLDGWSAPEPSPWFDQKFAARLREEAARKPEGFFERMRDRLLFNTGARMRPMLAGAMALVLVLGGGSYAGLQMSHPHAVQASATVQDLESLDKDEQALQQIDQLLVDDNAPDENTPTT